VNPATIEEVTVQLTGSLTAEVMGDGPQTNFVPRDGGNIFSGSFATDFGNSALQGDNISDELRARGAARPAICGAVRRRRRLRRPIARDRVWFFASSRYNEGSSYAPGQLLQQADGTLFYEPDLSRLPTIATTTRSSAPASRSRRRRSTASRSSRATSAAARACATC
jgi:hypothetical protein